VGSYVIVCVVDKVVMRECVWVCVDLNAKQTLLRSHINNVFADVLELYLTDIDSFPSFSLILF
jgi:hypothetical protein